MAFSVPLMLLAVTFTVVVGQSKDLTECLPEEMVKCTSALAKLNADSSFLDIGTTSADLDVVCPTLKEGMKCIEDYSDRCLKKEAKDYMKTMYNGSFSVIEELCTPGKAQDEYLKHAECMDSAKDQYRSCLDDHNQVMKKLDSSLKVGKNSASHARMICCSFREYIDCSKKMIFSRCGSETATFTETLLDRLSARVINEHCVNHLEDIKECDSILVQYKMDGVIPDDVVPEPESQGKVSDDDGKGIAAAPRESLMMVIGVSLAAIWAGRH